MRNRVRTLGLVFVLIGSSAHAQQPETENLILITLDGVRCQEIFSGLDLDIVRAGLDENQRVEDSPLYQRYWADTPEERRAKLMPFFWKELMIDHGSIAGNQALGSVVQLENERRFSYPGYSEILTGEAHDDVIDSNAKRRNPFPTVLEFLKDELGLRPRQVASFASWDVFDWIVAQQEGAFTSNAGYEPYDHPDAAVRRLSELQKLTPTPWDSVRHDLYTFRFALAHLKTYAPRVVYIALGETDDWAHAGRYDRTVEALARTDGFLRELWTFLSEHPQYRGRTTLVITTDHGRGNTPADWDDHGAEVNGAENVWVAFVGPDLSARGEWKDATPLSTAQIAATLCRFVGLDYLKAHPNAGRPIFEEREGTQRRRPAADGQSAKQSGSPAVE